MGPHFYDTGSFFNGGHEILQHGSSLTTQYCVCIYAAMESIRRYCGRLGFILVVVQLALFGRLAS